MRLDKILLNLQLLASWGKTSRFLCQFNMNLSVIIWSFNSQSWLHPLSLLPSSPTLDTSMTHNDCFYLNTWDYCCDNSDAAPNYLHFTNSVTHLWQKILISMSFVQSNMLWSVPELHLFGFRPCLSQIWYNLDIMEIWDLKTMKNMNI